MTPDLNPDASVSAAALHLLLAQHPELVELPVVWTIGLDATVRPFLTVDHPQSSEVARLLADALELTVAPHDYATSEGIPMRSYWVEGCWGSAPWLFVAYTVVPDAEQVTM